MKEPIRFSLNSRQFSLKRTQAGCIESANPGSSTYSLSCLKKVPCDIPSAPSVPKFYTVTPSAFLVFHPS